MIFKDTTLFLLVAFNALYFVSNVEVTIISSENLEMLRDAGRDLMYTYSSYMVGANFESVSEGNRSSKHEKEKYLDGKTFSLYDGSPFDVKTFRLPSKKHDEDIILKNLVETLQDSGIALVDCSDPMDPRKSIWTPETTSEKFQQFISKFAAEFDGHNDNEKNQFVWDVTPKPSQEAIEKAHFATPVSHSDGEFNMHTDGVYRRDPPRYFTLYSVNSDKMGGGQSKLVHGDTIVRKLHQMTGGKDILDKLQNPSWDVKVPKESMKNENDTHVLDKNMLKNITVTNYPFYHHLWSFRQEIMVPRSQEQEQILLTLEKLLESPSNQITGTLPDGFMLIMDNARWFHGRQKILDKERHLKRIRFNGFQEKYISYTS